MKKDQPNYKVNASSYNNDTTTENNFGPSYKHM